LGGVEHAPGGNVSRSFAFVPIAKKKKSFCDTKSRWKKKNSLPAVCKYYINVEKILSPDSFRLPPAPVRVIYSLPKSRIAVDNIIIIVFIIIIIIIIYNNRTIDKRLFFGFSNTTKFVRSILFKKKKKCMYILYCALRFIHIRNIQIIVGLYSLRQNK